MISDQRDQNRKSVAGVMQSVSDQSDAVCHNSGNNFDNGKKDVNNKEYP